MGINASMNGTTYEGVSSVSAGGKTISLVYVDDGGGLPQGVAEISAGSWTQESNQSSGTFDIAHGLSGKPDIIIVNSDYKTRYKAGDTAPNTMLVAFSCNRQEAEMTVAKVSSGYAGSTDAASLDAGIYAENSSDMGIRAVGDEAFTVKAYTNGRLGAGLTYSWIAIRLS